MSLEPPAAFTVPFAVIVTSDVEVFSMETISISENVILG